MSRSRSSASFASWDWLTIGDIWWSYQPSLSSYSTTTAVLRQLGSRSRWLIVPTSQLRSSAVRNLACSGLSVSTNNVITQGAVMNFENQNGLKTDGLAGPQVWTDLLADVLEAVANQERKAREARAAAGVQAPRVVVPRVRFRDQRQPRRPAGGGRPPRHRDRRLHLDDRRVDHARQADRDPATWAVLPLTHVHPGPLDQIEDGAGDRKSVV